MSLNSCDYKIILVKRSGLSLSTSNDQSSKWEGAGVKPDYGSIEGLETDELEVTCHLSEQFTR